MGWHSYILCAAAHNRRERTILMNRNVQYIERVVLAVSIILNVILGCSLYRAKVINKAYWLWFYWNKGVTINEDIFYKDAVKWVHDPQYLPDEN